MILSIYFSEIISPSHINNSLTNNSLNKDFKSVERPLEIEKFKSDSQIFSGWRIKKNCCAGFERMTLLVLLQNLIHYTTRSCSKNAWSISISIIKNKNFLDKKNRKTRDFEKM